MFSLEYLRQFTIFNYAIFDLVVSFLGIYLLAPSLSKLFKKIHINIPKKNWVYLTLPLSIIIHLLVQSFTPMTLDFLDKSGHYPLKIIIIILTYLGLRKISIQKIVGNN